MENIQFIKIRLIIISIILPLVIIGYFAKPRPAKADMSVIISSTGPYYLTDVKGKKLLPTFKSNEIAYVYYKYGIYFVKTTYGNTAKTFSPLRFKPVSGSVLMKVNNMSKYNIFRGVLEVRYSNFSNLLWVIEEVYMQDYLKGVAEEPESYNYEAMKAGVVAFRSYAYANMHKDVFYSYEPFDISSSTSYQRYTGRDNWYIGYTRETHGTKPNKLSKAVDATAGQTIVYKGSPARTVYFGSCNGKTKTHPTLPYLKSKSEPYCIGRRLSGHGYGMCMHGAQERAIRDKWSYKQLLSYYYSGISYINIKNPKIRVGVFSTSVANNNFPRFSDTDSYGTNVALSQRGWPSGSKYVFLTRGDIFPDALSAQSLSASMDAPILSTQKDSLPSVVRDEILRLDPGKIFILGDAASVSDSIEAYLNGQGIITERIAGQLNRYQTSAEINLRLNSSVHQAAILVSGNTYNEAMAGAVPAAKYRLPILLTREDSIPPEIENVLKKLGIKNIYIIGSNLVVSDSVKDYLTRKGYHVYRIKGNDIYETSVRVTANPDFKGKLTNLLIAGNSFHDILGIGPFSNKINAPLLMTEANSLPAPTYNYIKATKKEIKNIYIVGNQSSVSFNVEYYVAEASGKLR